jgi:hypothetical protein
MKFVELALAGIVVAMPAIPTLAHHSFAIFDAETTVTLVRYHQGIPLG